MSTLCWSIVTIVPASSHSIEARVQPDGESSVSSYWPGRMSPTVCDRNEPSVSSPSSMSEWSARLPMKRKPSVESGWASLTIVIDWVVFRNVQVRCSPGSRSMSTLCWSIVTIVPASSHSIEAVVDERVERQAADEEEAVGRVGLGVLDDRDRLGGRRRCAFAALGWVG
jgi:hypothetical protein